MNKPIELIDPIGVGKFGNSRCTRFTSRRTSGLILTVFFCLATCKLPSSDAYFPKQETILASLDGNELTLHEFETYLATAWKLENVSSRKRMFHDFLVEKILLREAEQNSISVSEEELKEQIGNYQVATDRDEFAKSFRKFLMVQKLLKLKVHNQIKVESSHIRRYYETNRDQFQADDSSRVLEIREVLENGNIRSFREAARLYSKGLTAESGGTLGTFERGHLPREFEKVILPLQPGEVSSVFRSRQGYHLFMVEEWIPRRHKKLYDVQEEIFATLVAEQERAAVDKYIEDLLAKASLQIYDSELDFQKTRDYVSLAN